MFDFSGGLQLGDWGINIGVGAGNTGAYPNGGYPTYPTYPTTYPVTRTDNSNQQLLMLGLIVLAFLVLRKG